MLLLDLQPRDSARKCPGFSSFCLKSRPKVDFSGTMLVHLVFMVVPALAKYLKYKISVVFSVISRFLTSFYSLNTTTVFSLNTFEAKLTFLFLKFIGYNAA